MMPNQQNPQTPQSAGTEVPGPIPVGRPAFHWYEKVAAVLFVAFCLEIGIFLVAFPWTAYWDTNYFASSIPAWRQYWGNMYVRGAVSGLGVVNIYISMVEIFRLRRFAGR